MPATLSGSTQSPVYTMSPPSSPSPSPSWKNIFRVTSKKGHSNPHEPHLTLDTHHFMSSAVPDAPLSAFVSRPEHNAHVPLTPASMTRYSYNSSDTHSSDSGARRHPQALAAPAEDRSALPSPSHSVSNFVASTRQRTKSDKTERFKRLGRKPPATASSSQQSFKVTTPPRQGGPLSPRSMSASASRFIRRVASAPNTKNLFSRDSRHSPTHSVTRNGLLSPAAEIVPPLPGTIVAASGAGGDGHSLETISSRSSRGPSRARAHTTQGKPSPGRDQTATGPEALGRAPFRRTYSSNSIKVGHVSACFF